MFCASLSGALSYINIVKTSKPPDETGKESGTIPFASAELINERRFQRFQHDPPVHGPVHDMESLFWVLLYICITLEGNKWICRAEHQPETYLKSGLKRQVRELFEEEVPKKAYCLMELDEFEQTLPFVHSYFDSLKPLLLKLRWVLYLAHSYESVERYNIHNIVLAILDEAIVGLRQDRDDSVVLETKRKRREDWNDWKSTLGPILDGDEQMEGPDHLQGLGGDSQVSKVQNNLLLASVPHTPPGSPPSAPRKRSRRMT